ncbi:MAG: hypothetical protein JO168_17830 [Solirubrobacterales bacterium]|nr:hypothetical protein [Solirubrobacterales bacterium]MBV9716384.1 hypothetical protein [Solirubrobacterales bacterium]
MTRGGEYAGDVQPDEANRIGGPAGMPESGEAPTQAAPGGPAPAEGSASATATRQRFHPEVEVVAVVFAAASIFFGIFPTPLFTLAGHAGRALLGLL